MAINCLNTNSARVDFGQFAVIGGLTAITMAFTLKPSNLNGGRFLSQWNGSNNAPFITLNSTTDFRWLLRGVFDVTTSGMGLSTSGTFRIVLRWASGGTKSIWSNGASILSASGDVGSIGSSPGPSCKLSVGFEALEGASGVEGDYSEFAVWSAYMPDSFATAYGKGFSPSFFTNASSLLYSPMLNTATIHDVWGNNPATNTGGTSSAHPSIIMPRRNRAVFVPAAAGVSFQAAWAVRPQVIGTGIY